MREIKFECGVKWRGGAWAQEYKVNRVNREGMRDVVEETRFRCKGCGASEYGGHLIVED